MPHLYKNIEGWCTYTDFYKEMVDLFGHKGDAIFCEVGCWFGQSSVYLLELIQETGASVEVHFVDNWLGGKDAPYEQTRIAEFGGGDKVYGRFTENIALVPQVKTIVNRKDSVIAADDYPEYFFDFIFIDAGHESYECYDDMIAWYPKLKLDGIMAGHDIDSEWVQTSTDRFAKEHNVDITRLGSPAQCWKLIKD